MSDTSKQQSDIDAARERVVEAARNPLVTRLRKMGACNEAIEWVEASGHTDMQAAWDACERADWMLWLVGHLDGCYSPRLRLAACACARTALRYVPEGEDRPLRAIECAERYARGDVTAKELDAAMDAARDAAWNSAWSAARDAARDAARNAARAAAMDAAMDAAMAAAMDAALRDMAALVRQVIQSPEVPDGRAS